MFTVTAVGSHDELIAHGGYYARMFALQAKGYASGVASEENG